MDPGAIDLAASDAPGEDSRAETSQGGDDGREQPAEVGEPATVAWESEPRLNDSLAQAVLSMGRRRRLPTFIFSGEVPQPTPAPPAAPVPSPSLDALRAATDLSLTSEDHRGRRFTGARRECCRECFREITTVSTLRGDSRSKCAGSASSDCPSATQAPASSKSNSTSILPQKRPPVSSFRCPIQAVSHHIVRKIDALALGRRVTRPALASNMLPTSREPELVDMLGARVYNSRFIGNHGLLVATAQNSRACIYDTSDTDLFVRTHDIYCHNTSWTISDVDIVFEGGPDGHEPLVLVYSSLNNLVQLVDLQGTADQRHVHDALDFSPNGDVKAVWSLQLSQDSRQIVSGTGLRDEYGHFGFSHDAGGGIVVYDMEHRKVAHSFRAHERDTNAVTYLDRASDPNLLVSGSDDALACLWDLREMRRAASDGSPNRPACTFVGHVCFLLFFSQGKTGFSRFRVFLLTFPLCSFTFVLFACVRDRQTHGLTHVESRNDSRYFLTTSKDSSSKLFDVRCPSSSDRSQWKIRRDLNYDYRFNSAELPRAVPPGSDSTDASVITYRGGHSVLKTLIRSRFSPATTTAQRYIYTGSADGACAIYEASTGALLERLDYHMSPSRDVSWHPYQPLLVIGSWDHSITSWHPATKGCRSSWKKKR